MSAERKLQHEQGQLVTKIRQISETVKKKRHEDLQEMQRMNDRMDEIEVKNQQLTKRNLKLVNMLRDNEEKITEMEKKMYRVSSKSPEYAEKSSQIKIFEKAVRYGTDVIPIDLQRKYLRTDVGDQGGFLCPPEYATEIIKRITEISPIRAVARVRTITRESLMIPQRNFLMQGYWVGEGVPTNESNSQYALNELKTKKLAVYVDSTIEQLEDAAFDMEAEITKDAAERFAQMEGQAFVLGDGINMPEGILTNPNIQIVPSGVSNSITADSLINVTGQLKVGYNPAYAMNRTTIAFIRQLKDGIGRYLWEPGLAGGNPNTVNGYPYINAIDVPDIGSDEIPVIFGDFYRGYTIADRTVMLVIRDALTQAVSGKVRFVFMRRVAGQVVMDEAFKFIQCAA